MKKLLLMLAASLIASAAKAQVPTTFPASLVAPEAFNTGTVRLSVLSGSDKQLTTNFLFEQGSRNSWHYHPKAQQVLLVLNGEGYYQEEGKPKQLIRKGDVVVTAPDVRHWNGATPYSSVECMTVSDLVQGEQHAVQLRKVTDEEFASLPATSQPMVRMAEIEVYPEHLEAYLASAHEVGKTSVEVEPGVVCLFPMQHADAPTQISILEIYASEEAYRQHLQTPHFQKYKQDTRHMVKSLRLSAMQPLNPAMTPLLFRKAQ